MGKYDVKRSLERNIPSMLRLIGNQNISWTKINSRLDKHLIQNKEKCVNTGIEKVKVEATFYSFLVGQYVGKSETFGMFDFFNSTFEQLHDRLSKKELVYIHKIIKSILTNFDSKYLNFIGEIATLNAYKSNRDYELLNIEEPIYDYKNVKADFFLKRIFDGKQFFVEVVNIHLQHRNLIESESIKKHIEGKIIKKVERTLFSSPRFDVYIQPVIWTENTSQLKVVSELYKSNKIEIKNVYVPLSLLTIMFSEGVYRHRFEYVNTILDEKNKLKRIVEKIRHSFFRISKV